MSTRRIQLRRGTPEQWTADNPVLAAGEPGVETTTYLFKIGDGITAWNDLEYYPIQEPETRYFTGTTAPSPPLNGDVWMNTTKNRLFQYDHSQTVWIEI